jgi:imidazolonepropionase-like amidohydrolase
VLLLPSGVFAKGNPPILIRGSNIFDGSSPKLLTGMDVLIENGLITRIGENLSAPGGAQVIDADWCTLMPGPIDMHWHHKDGRERQTIKPRRSRNALIMKDGKIDRSKPRSSS